MDFILSLTHFCEVHGPTSILCSQILPTPCQQCSPGSAASSPGGSPSSPSSSSSIHVRDARHASVTSTTAPDLSSSPSSARCVTTSAIEPLATPPASAPVIAPRIEDHPWFASEKHLRTTGGVSNLAGVPEKKSVARFGGGSGGGSADGDTCASCRLKLPEDVSRQLPLDANGSLEDRGNHSSPVLRSREVVYSCRGSHADHFDQDDDYTCSTSVSSSHHHTSGSGSNNNNYYSPASVHSSYSSDSSCHTHVVTYLSMRGPANPDDYSLLRRASIRTLSCELLPRGLSSGPLSFGDPSAGYTVAYVFRLPDPMARGKRRSYALVALAGKDAGRTFKASPLIWRTFARIANNIVSAAEKFQEGEKVREPAVPVAAPVTGRNYTPISSFLTGRALDPDGQPRRAGQVRARNLIEIVGNEYIFAELHAQFVALLQQLSAMFASPSDSHHADMYDDYAAKDYISSRSSDRLRRTGSTGGSDRGSIDHDRSATAIGATSLAKQFSQLHMSTSVPKPIPISQRRKMVA